MADLGFDRYEGITGDIPAECIDDCAAGGDVTESVEYWRNKLGLVTLLEPVRPDVERYLREYGCWNDLDTTDMGTLAGRVLWLTSGDRKESARCS